MEVLLGKNMDKVEVYVSFLDLWGYIGKEVSKRV